MGEFLTVWEENPERARVKIDTEIFNSVDDMRELEKRAKVDLEIFSSVKMRGKFKLNCCLRNLW